MKVNVAPDMGMYQLLRNQGYDPAYAIAEFIDNALQAHLSRPKASRRRREAVTVSIKFYSNEYPDQNLAQSIFIEDDGPGIPRARLADAMKPAKKSQIRGLSEFGIGMKAAAVWFTDTWALTTTPENENQSHALTFNLNTLLRSRKEEVDVTSLAAGGNVGTRIELLKTRRTIDKERYVAICAELRDLYQRFTAGPAPRLKLKAYYDDTPRELTFEPNLLSPVLEAPAYKLGKNKAVYTYGKPKVWSVSIDTTFKGSRVTGTISLLERGSYKLNPGLVMFRHERVITGTTQRPYLPVDLFGTGNKYARQRVYGELFADDLPVTYTKDGFDFNDADFAAQLLTSNELRELLDQAEAYRAGDTTKITQHFKSHADMEKQLGKAAAAAAKGAGKSSATTKTPGKPGQGGTTGGNTGGASKTRPPAPPPPPPEPLVKVLTQLQGSSSSTSALQSVIAETMWLHRARRDIATAMCLRAVLEVGLLLKIERSFPNEYPKVAKLGVAALINYLAGQTATFFPGATDFRVKKSVGSIAAGHQTDVLLLNNAAHAHYAPNTQELNKLASNLEVLLDWAYS